jgi:hypothetical protein
MTVPNPWLARFVIVAVSLALCGAPELVAQSAPAQPDSRTQPQPQTGIVDPAQGPLQPVPPQEVPDAPSTSTNEPHPSPQQSAPLKQEQKKNEQPLGAAVGQAGVTAGGGASKPAGNAIAPAKQRQVRSFLIKLGLIGAAGIAVGTVVALTKTSPSNPPGSR